MTTRLTAFRLPEDVLERLAKLAAKNKTTKTAIVLQALAALPDNDIAKGTRDPRVVVDTPKVKASTKGASLVKPKKPLKLRAR